jgi:hypothetical protein
MQSATILMPLLNIARPIAISGFLNMLIKAFYPEFIERLSAASDNIDFDALINSIINFLKL